MPTAIEELAGKLQSKQQELEKIFSKNRTDTGDYNFNNEQLDDVRKRNEELEDLGKELDSKREAIELADANKKRGHQLNQPVNDLLHDGEPGAQQKSIGQQFIESEGYNKGRGQSTPDIKVEIKGAEYKTTMTTTQGFEPDPRSSRIVPMAQQRVVVGSLIPTSPTTNDVIVYHEETGYTNNAAPTAENAPLPEAAIEFTKQTSHVKKIGTVLPISEEQLDDAPFVRGEVDGRMALMVEQESEGQYVSGDGTGDNHLGITQKTGVQTFTRSTGQNNADAYFHAITKVNTAGFTATGAARVSGAIINPQDWMTIRLMKTNDGAYIFGSPAQVNIEMIWGITFAQTAEVAQGTGIVGDFLLYSHRSLRRGVLVEAGLNGDDFRNVRLTLRAYKRESFEIYRANAFCVISNLTLNPNP